MLDIRALPQRNLAEKEFIDDFYNQFNFADQFDNVVSLNYTGVIAGSEFLLYEPEKLYVCLSFDCSCINPAVAIHGMVEFFDEANAPVFSGQNNAAFEIAPPILVNYIRNNVFLQNFYFSRLLQQAYIYMKFIGYRITF